MALPKSTPAELIEALRDLARAGRPDVFPNIALEEMIETEAADFIEEVEKLLLEIANSGGPFAERALAVLVRLS